MIIATKIMEAFEARANGTLLSEAQPNGRPAKRLIGFHPVAPGYKPSASKGGFTCRIQRPKFLS